MHTIFSLLLAFSILLSAHSVCAQEAPSVLELATAIHRIKTGERGIRPWRECGQRLSPDEALARATEYATYFLEEHAEDPQFNPWIGAAIAMQESSFNRCAISSEARASFETQFRATYDRDPTETDIVRLLRNRTWRSRMGVTTAFDAGLVQFRWPGAVARRVGMTDAGTLVNARTSVHMLALSMERYRTACRTISSYRGLHTVNRRDGTVRVVRYSIPCEDGYWVQHNSPSRFNYRYYHNVMRRHAELVRLSARPVPLEEDES